MSIQMILYINIHVHKYTRSSYTSETKYHATCSPTKPRPPLSLKPHLELAEGLKPWSSISLALDCHQVRMVLVQNILWKAFMSAYICVCVTFIKIQTHKHTHTNIYIYIHRERRVCMCGCACEYYTYIYIVFTWQSWWPSTGCTSPSESKPATEVPPEKCSAEDFQVPSAKHVIGLLQENSETANPEKYGPSQQFNSGGSHNFYLHSSQTQKYQRLSWPRYGGFYKWGYPRSSFIFSRLFHEINHPSMRILPF